MNALQKRLAEYQNGGTFPDYAELIELAETLHDEPQPVKYVDVEKIKSLCRKSFHFGQTYWQQADSEYTSHHKKADITMGKFNDLLNEIQELLAPHQIEQPEPARYVDVEKVMQLVNFVSDDAWGSAANRMETAIEMQKRIIVHKETIQKLLAPHELKRLSDEDIDSLLIDYNELIWDRSNLSAPEAMQWIVRRVESKVRGEE